MGPEKNSGKRWEGHGEVENDKGEKRKDSILKSQFISAEISSNEFFLFLYKE